MPITIDNELPAKSVLESENIFVMTTNRAIHQDIRPLKILILNLMPLKIHTETQLMRRLSNTPLQIEVGLLHPETYKPTHTPQEHMDAFYTTFSAIKEHNFDGLIITGAPVEHLEFEEVKYWEELTQILDWAKTHVTSTLYICWAAQAALYHQYGIQKQQVPSKIFGVYEHVITDIHCPLVRGFDDRFFAPHSRHTDVPITDIIKIPELQLLSYAPDAGAYIVASLDKKNVYVFGHSEYDPHTLYDEYMRDLDKGASISMPVNYFIDNNPKKGIKVTWRSHSNLLFANWINYYVYQETPYVLE